LAAKPICFAGVEKYVSSCTFRGFVVSKYFACEILFWSVYYLGIKKGKRAKLTKEEKLRAKQELKARKAAAKKSKQSQGTLKNKLTFVLKINFYKFSWDLVLRFCEKTQ